jgi:hypothetical protein
MGYLYGCRYVRVAALDSDGEVPTTPTWTVSDTPQQFGCNLVTSNGQTIELRGGDRLLASINESDEYLGFDLTFQDAKLDGEFLVATAGGEYDDQSGEYTPPAMGAAKKRFMAEIYMANYEGGIQHEGDLVGYTVLCLWNVTASLPTLAPQQRQFLIPQVTWKARDNVAASKRFFTFKSAAALPTP